MKGLDQKTGLEVKGETPADDEVKPKKSRKKKKD
jgi:hypothetical protein